MTRKEAIKYWVDFREEIDQFMDECWMSEDIAEQKEATDMAIAALREQPRWISVAERLPEQRNDYLAATKDGGVYEADFIPSKKQWWIGDDERLDVTHWMPLPEPPEVKA